MKDLINLKDIAENNKPFFYRGKKVTYIGEHVDITIGIGKDETACITMSLEAYSILMEEGE